MISSVGKLESDLGQPVAERPEICHRSQRLEGEVGHKTADEVGDAGHLVLSQLAEICVHLQCSPIRNDKDPDVTMKLPDPQL